MMPRRTLLTRTIPVSLSTSHPGGVYISKPEGRQPEPGSPPVRPLDRLRLWGFLFYTYNQSNPLDFDSIICSPMTKGYNWAQWEQALTARILARGGDPAQEIIIAGQQVTLKKQAALDAASMLHVCVLGHSPPKEHIQAIKARSLVSTRVLTGLHNLESCAQATQWAPLNEVERQVLRQYPLDGKKTSGCLGDGLNAYGCTCIDKYERWDSCGGYTPMLPDATDLCDLEACGPGKPPLWTPGYVACPHSPAHAGLPANANPASKHTWDIDLTDASEIASELVNVIEVNLANYYTVGGLVVLDGLLFDNHSTDPYLGMSTLQYPTGWTAVYRAGWKLFDSQVALWLAGLPVPYPDWFYWANCTDKVDIYNRDDLKNRWVEAFFVSGSNPRAWAGVGGIEEALDRAKSENLRIVLGATGTYTGQHYWMVTSGSSYPPTYGDWAQVYAKVKALGAWDNVYVQALRQTSGGYACWQEGWEVLR